jgi:hypothetical protein
MAQQLTPADQEKLNKLIAEGKKLAKQLGDELSAASLDNIKDDLNTAEKLVQGLRDEWKEYTNDVAGTREGFTRIVDEIKNMNSGTKAARSSFSNLASLAQKLQSHQEGINKLSSKEIDNLKKQTSERTNDLKLAGKLAKDQIKALEARNSLSNKEQQQLEEARAAHANITQEITENIGFIKQFEDQLDEAGRKAKNLEDSLGLAGNATKAMSESLKGLGMGSLSDKLGLDEAQSKMEEMAAKITDGGESAATMGNKFKVMGAGVKSMASSLGKNLLDPAFLVAEFGKALKLVDDGAGDMAKQMNMTYGEALNTRRELGNMAAMSGDVALNTKGLQETYMAVGQSLGTNAKLNEKDLITFTKLREQAGYTNEELAGIQKLSLVNGKTLEDNTKEILGGAQAYASRRGFVVNEKEVLKEVSKASASLKLSLGGSAEAVAEAVVKTKEFGLSLEQASKMSESLLNFESSIESELSAELLTGKNLNLEKARQLALNNDIAGAAEEIAKQVGTSADFANMNAIQQEAIAKAAGLTKDELAQSLMDREALTKLSGVEGKDAQEKFNNLVKQVGLEEAKKQLGNEQLANQYEQQSVQERFAQATEKLQEMFVQLAEPVLAFISPIMDLVSTVLPLVNILLQPIVFTVQTIASVFTSIKDLITNSLPGLITFGTVLAGILITQQAIAFKQQEGLLYATAQWLIEKKNLIVEGLIQAKKTITLAIENRSLIATIAEAAMTAFKSVANIPIVGPILGAVAAAGAVALGYSLMKGNDIMSPGEGSAGYGKRTLMGPEGAIQLNNRDTVIAGTDLFKKGDDVMSAPKGAITVANSTAPAPAKPDSNSLLASEMKRGNDLREQQMRKDRTVSTLKIQ